MSMMYPTICSTSSGNRSKAIPAMPFESWKWIEIEKKEFYKLAEVLVDLNKFRVAPEVRISLELKFYFSGKCNCDIDNLCKTTLDFLQDKGVFKNDKQVKHLDANVLENMLLNGVYTKITTITRKH